MNNSTRSSDKHITTLDVAEMSCEACVRHVTRALEGMIGVVHVDVSLRDHQAVVEHLPASVGVAGLVQAVRDAGYDARERQTEPDAGSGSPRATGQRSCGCGSCVPPAAVSGSANPGPAKIG